MAAGNTGKKRAASTTTTTEDGDEDGGVTRIEPISVQIVPTAAGVEIHAKTRDRKYVLDMPWNGWVSVMLHALAEVVERKVGP